MVGLRLRHGVPEHRRRQQVWGHGCTQRTELPPRLRGSPSPWHARLQVGTSFGHASTQPRTGQPALELPPCNGQGRVTVPPCPNQPLPTPPALTDRAVGLGRGGWLRGLLLQRLGWLGRLCKQVESVPPWSWGEEVRLKEGSKQGGERREMYGQERGRGGCLQGDREEGVRWGGTGLGVGNVHWPGGG